MEGQNYTQAQNVFNNGPQTSLPNATAVLILGIVSIPTCCCGGIIGLICGIIALILAKKDMDLYASTPGNYTPASFNNLKAGRICAIIGTILSALYLLWTIFVVARYGIQGLSNPEIMRQMMGQ